MSHSRTIPLAIIFGGCVLALAVYYSVPRQAAPVSGNPSLVRAVGASDHILGNPAAPVEIIEYADFDCEYCKGFEQTLHQIVANEGATGKVSWVFREFPLTEIHPNALSHAQAAECAAVVGGNDGFWKFADALYDHQPIDPTSYGAIAASAGLPGDAFATCFATASSTLDARIAADRQNALDMGAQGTPFSVIVAPGKAPIPLVGAYSYDALKLLVDQALAQ